MSDPSSGAMPTPRRLRLHLASIWVAAALMFLVGESALATARSSMRTMGKDAAPSILAAQEIASDLADLDANAGNYLFKTGKDGARAAFEQKRRKVLGRMVDAAENITFGDAEKTPINNLFEGLTLYLGRIAEMRTLEDDGRHDRAVGAYLAASVELHERVLPAATALDSVNAHHMDVAYASAMKATTAASALSVLLGTGLIVTLVAAQLFVFRHMRRVFTPGLVVATALALAQVIYVSNRVNEARATLRVAQDDAFASIHTLWRARAIAYDANGDETRWLIDPAASAAQWEPTFDARVKLLTSEPAIPKRVRDEMDRVKVGGPKMTAMKGLFADALSNLTFAGEPQAARRMVEAFAKYYAIDRQIRDLERKGRHDDAVELCTGTKAGQSNAAFAAFDTALSELVDVNMKAFQSSIDGGLADLASAEVADPALTALIALLAFFGIRPRLREYALCRRPASPRSTACSTPGTSGSGASTTTCSRSRPTPRTGSARAAGPSSRASRASGWGRPSRGSRRCSAIASGWVR